MTAEQAPEAVRDGRATTRRTTTGWRRDVRAAHVAGFVLVLALWTGAVGDLACRVRQVDRELDAMTERFIRTDDAIQTIRTSVMLGAIDWRDAFLDLAPGKLDYYRERLFTHQDAAGRALAALDVVADPGVRAAVAELRREVEAYWSDVFPLVSADTPRDAVGVRRVILARVIPKRAQALRIVEQVQQINRNRLQQQQRDSAAIYARAETRVALSGSMATILSLLVGVLVFVHVTTLERQLRAELAANAIITTDLHRLSAQLVRAQEDERRLIARELHDEVGQALTAVKLHLSLLKRPNGGDDASDIDDAKRIVDGALQSTRNLSRLLHPPMLDDMGLAAAVSWYLRGFSERTGLMAGFEHAGTERRAAPEIETCLYRVVQEVTTNVARHARATTCRVYLQRLPASFVLTIEDDGRGFDPAAGSAGHAPGLGLLGIRERVAGFRGVFRLDTATGAGTRITVELPALDAPGSVGEAADGADSARG